MLTAKSEKQDLLDCLEAGADDYLCKPVSADELRARLFVAGRILDLQQQLLSACHQAQYEASHDSVTGLWSRASIMKFVNHHLARCAKIGDALSLVLVEISGLKDVNNRFGRAMGDKVLREVAERLRGSVQAYDSIGRYVGGEFLIIMPGCSTRRVDALIDQIGLNLVSPPIPLPVGTAQLQAKAAFVVLSETTSETTEQLLSRLERNLAYYSRQPKPAVEVSLPAPTAGEIESSRLVLVVGSDPLQRVSLARRVAALGYPAQEAGSRDAALEILKGAREVGALMLDMRTPEPEELDFIAELRADPGFTDLNVLVVGAWPVQQTVIRALSLNVSNFLPKPLDLVILGQCLSHVLGVSAIQYSPIVGG